MSLTTVTMIRRDFSEYIGYDWQEENMISIIVKILKYFHVKNLFAQNPRQLKKTNKCKHMENFFHQHIKNIKILIVDGFRETRWRKDLSLRLRLELESLVPSKFPWREWNNKNEIGEIAKDPSILLSFESDSLVKGFNHCFKQQRQLN